MKKSDLKDLGFVSKFDGNVIVMDKKFITKSITKDIVQEIQHIIDIYFTNYTCDGFKFSDDTLKQNEMYVFYEKKSN